MTPRTKLHEPEIVDAAIRLVERDGVEALSMRRLGAELDVEAMSLYHHVANRQALLDAIAGRVLEPVARLEHGEDWRAACERFAVALRGVALAHPACFRLVAFGPLEHSSLMPVERLMSVLLRGGFRPAEALAVYRALASYTRGYALAEAAGFTVDGRSGEGRRRLAGLDPAVFPVLHGWSDSLRELTPDAAFRMGLDALLDGIAARR